MSVAAPPESGTEQAPAPQKALPPARAADGASRNTAGAIAMNVHENVLREKRYWQAIAERLEPLPMLLFCPACGHQHVDAPEPERDWTNPPHRSHLCAGCGGIWRPADFPTTGIAAIRTKGKVDTWTVEYEAVPTGPAKGDKREEGGDAAKGEATLMPSTCPEGMGDPSVDCAWPVCRCNARSEKATKP